MKRFGAIVLFAGAVLLSTHILAPAEPPARSASEIAAGRAALQQAIVDAGNTPEGIAALKIFWGNVQGLAATTSQPYAVLSNALQALKLEQRDVMPPQ